MDIYETISLISSKSEQCFRQMFAQKMKTQILCCVHFSTRPWNC